jgi:4-amino-4-deoxy-L-arabinose transferase-like glycosyltransferase
VRGSIAEWRARRAKFHYMGHQRTGDAFPEFLVLWALIPVVFFSFSDSKLPGYILPSIPPLTILSGDYLNRMRERGLKPWLLILHAVLAGGLTSLVLLLPRLIQHSDKMPPANALIAAGTTGFAAAIFILITVARFGIRRLRIATMIPIVILVLFLYGIGPFFGFGQIASTKGTVQLIDLTYSARPLSHILDQIAPSDGTIAVYKVRRDVEYGISFYRDRKVVNYELDGIPSQQHILVARESYVGELRQKLTGRRYEPLFVYPAQNLVVYAVAAQQ